MSECDSIFPQVYLKLDDASNLKETLEAATNLNYVGVISNIFSNQYIREFLDPSIQLNQQEFARSPMILLDWKKVYPHLNVPNLNVNDEDIANNNRLQLQQELDFANHVKKDGFILLSMGSDNAEAMGSFFKDYLQKQPFWITKFLVVVNMRASTPSSDYYDIADDDEWPVDQWKVWNRFHAATGYNSRFMLNLTLSPELPPEEEIHRWLGEKIGMLTIPKSCFVTKGGFCSLRPTRLEKVVKLIHVNANCALAVDAGDESILAQRFIINYLHSELKNLSGFIEDNHKPVMLMHYQLQPPSNNFDATTHKMIEEEDPKYILYQRAIEKAIQDMIPESDKQLTLLLVGGRQGMVRAAVDACKIMKRKQKIIIVEKNPSVVMILRDLISETWPDEDIKLLTRPDEDIKLDILVSELLGRFGDCDLSPEVLECAHKLLKHGGVSIPCASTSYLRPVMSWKIYHGIILGDHIWNRTPCKIFYPRANDAVWLTCLNNVYNIDDPKEIFKFTYPNLDLPISNCHQKILNFEAKEDCIIHGFAGYFTAQLYKDIEISIHPATHTEGMSSCYPIFFPAHEPIFVKKNENIELEISRETDGQKVWYKWKVQRGPMQNEDAVDHLVFLH